MRAVVQRVSEASITVNGNFKGSMNGGLVVLLGIEDADSRTDCEWLCAKICNLRIFNDEAGVMNRSLLETGGDLLLVSQFTLHASTRKGNRPSYIRASKPAHAIPLYELCIQLLEEGLKKTVLTGEFGADMKVSLVNDGPVTIIIDSQNKE